MGKTRVKIPRQAPTNIVVTYAETYDEGIPDNIVSGTTIATLSATDANTNETHTFSEILDADNKFQITGASLKINGALSYGTATTHSVTIRVTDSSARTFDKIVTIDVLNSGANPIVANQTADFGALTRANAGVWHPTNTGGAITSASITGGTANDGHWVIETDGGLYRDQAGVSSGTLACSYNGGADTATITVNAIANAYSVETSAELEAVLELAALAYGDKVLLRTATYSNLTSIRPAANCPLGTFTTPTDKAATVEVNGVTHYHQGSDLTTGNYVIVTPHTGATPTLNRITLDGTASAKGGFWFKDLTFSETFADEIVGAAPYLLIFKRQIANIAISGCTFVSTDSLNGYDVASGINCNTTTGHSGFKIIDNTFQNLSIGINFPAACNSMDIIGNDMSNIWVDAIKLRGGSNVRHAWNKIYNKETPFRQGGVVAITKGATTVVQLEAGVIATYSISAGHDVRFVGLGGMTQLNDRNIDIASVNSGANTITLNVNSTSYSNYTSGGTAYLFSAHPDFHQWQQNGETFDNVLICGNRYWLGESEGDFGQGQGDFMSPLNAASSLTNLVIIFELYVGSNVNGISVENATDPIIRNNTVVNHQYGSTSYASSGIDVSSGSGGTITDNVADFFSPAGSNNIDLLISATSGATSHAETFEDPASFGDLTDPVTQYAIKATSTAFAASPKCGSAGTGYVNYTDRTISAAHLA